MRRIAVVLLVAAALAGCLADPPASPSDEDDATGPVESSGPTPQNGTDTEPTLKEPPDWEIGTWWRFRITERISAEQRSFEATRVVADLETSTDSHLVGMPTAGWSDPALLLHVPGFGRVDRQTLGFEIHDCPFKPLDFPLEDGKTWETEFECRPVDATVTVESDTVATIRMIGGNDDLTLTYDAEVGAIVEMDIADYGLVEVLESGTGFDEEVTIPHMHDLVFQHGRIAGAIDLGLQPAPPVETVSVDETYHRVSFVFIVGTVVPQLPAQAGFYREEAIAPDDTSYTTTVTPEEGSGIRFAFNQHEDPGGEWELRHVAGGAGIAMTEGIGYHVYTRDLG